MSTRTLEFHTAQQKGTDKERKQKCGRLSDTNVADSKGYVQTYGRFHVSEFLEEVKLQALGSPLGADGGQRD